MPLPVSDLAHVLAHTVSLWDDLRGCRVFLTGGTGFFGVWILESFADAVDRLGLDSEIVVLSRDPAAFARKCPHLAGHRAITVAAGDVCSFVFPGGEFSHVIHAATEASTTLNPLVMLDTITNGTRRVLEFAAQCGCRRFLLASSGGVYGRQPPELLSIPEDYRGAPELGKSTSAYGEGKRMAEFLCTIIARSAGFDAVSVRGFAFVGPGLPLDRHFAVGNFLRDALHGGPVKIGGDGTPVRSYLYAADLAIWLWTLLLRGTPGAAYNVGSDEAVTIEVLAHKVASQFSPVPPVEIAKEPPRDGRLPERYVPSVERARSELGLDVWVTLDDALCRTAAYEQGKRVL